MTSLQLKKGKRPAWLSGLFISGALVLGSASSYAIVHALGLIGSLHEPVGTEFRMDQHTDINGFVGTDKEKFDFVFVQGDEFFEISMNVLDGAGANVGDGTRFTRVPRADLQGKKQWAKHFPRRATGPNGQGCVECHNTPFGTFAGNSALAVHRDPMHSGDISMMIRRDTPHLAGSGALQRLAEEMTTDLHAIRDEAAAKACATGHDIKRTLVTKGVKFGWLKAVPQNWHKKKPHKCKAHIDMDKVRGIDHDLVVKPYQWKGSDATLRIFNRGALHNELGVQATELVGYGKDGDGDKVVDEASVGDVTGLVVYIAGQPRPTTKIELGEHEAETGFPKVDDATKALVAKGEKVFEDIGCAKCHKPYLILNNPVFSEPSQHPAYRDVKFPSGDDPLAEGLDPADPVYFDLTKDLPDNDIEVTGLCGPTTMGNFECDGNGGAIVRLYGDLKRHFMGYKLGESIDEVGTGSATFITKELWGVGDTAPYLHDGRATTLTEAILEHGGAAGKSRKNFKNASAGDQEALIAFLNNLALFKGEEEE